MSQGVGSSTSGVVWRRKGRRRYAVTVPSVARDSWPKAANSLDGRANTESPRIPESTKCER